MMMMGQMRSRAVVWTAVTVGVTVAVTACSPSSPDRYLPPSPPVVQIVMHDYRYEHPPVFPRGRVVIRAPNLGKVPHEIVVTEEREDAPPIDEQLRGDAPSAAPTFTVVAATPPGQTGTLAVDLVPGRYALICFLQDADGQQHSLKGMSSEFRVR